MMLRDPVFHVLDRLIRDGRGDEPRMPASVLRRPGPLPRRSPINGKSGILPPAERRQRYLLGNGKLQQYRNEFGGQS